MQGVFEPGGREGRVPEPCEGSRSIPPECDFERRTKERTMNRSAGRTHHARRALLGARAVTVGLLAAATLCGASRAQMEEPADPTSPPNTNETMPAIDLSAPLSLDEVYRLSESRNLSYLRSLASVESSHGSYVSARSALFPTARTGIDVSRTVSKFDEPMFDPTSQRFVTDATEYSSGLSLSGGVSLFDPPSIFRFRQASANLDAAEHQVDRSRQTLRNQIASVYFELVRAKERDIVAREAYELSSEQLRRAETLFELGSVARSDVLQAQVNLASADRDRITAANVIELQRSQLALALGVPVTSPVDVEAAPPLPAVLPEDREDLVQDAIATRPDVQAAQADLRAAQFGVKSAKWQRYPTIDGSYSYSRRGDHLNDVTDDFDRGYSFSLRAGLSWTLFDGFNTKGNIERAEAARRSQSLLLEETELQAALDVRASLIAIKNASESIRSAEEGVRLAEESVKLQQALYESGGGTLLEWNNSQVELTRARVSLVDAQVDLHLALAGLELALGR
jgi:outer membrane protein